MYVQTLLGERSEPTVSLQVMKLLFVHDGGHFSGEGHTQVGMAVMAINQIHIHDPCFHRIS